MSKKKAANKLTRDLIQAYGQHFYGVFVPQYEVPFIYDLARKEILNGRSPDEIMFIIAESYKGEYFDVTH